MKENRTVGQRNALANPLTLRNVVIEGGRHHEQLLIETVREVRGRAVRPRRGPALALVISLFTTARDLLLPRLAPR